MSATLTEPRVQDPRPSRPPFLERDNERRRIAATLAQARAGQGSLTIVEGAEGIGLTALLAAARAMGEAQAMRVLRARGAELERDFAFGVVRQLFERTLAEAAATEREELLRGPAGVAARLLALPGAGDDRIDADDAGRDSSFAVLHGLHWLCANLAARRPLLIAIDDAHRADSPSLRFLHYLRARLDDLPIAILVGAPLVERHPGDELLAALTTDADVLRLRPLSAEAVGRVLEDGLGTTPTPGFAAACHDATGGTPFFVRRLVDELRAAGVAPTDEQADRVAALGGRAMARQVRRRLHDLTPAAGRLAHAVAVLECAELNVAAELAGLDAAQGPAAADELVAAGFLANRRPLACAHPVIRAAVYDDLSTAQRSRGHLLAARVLADAGAGDERVAEHLLATEPAGDAWVVERLAAAGRAAARGGAPDAAAVLLRRAVAEPPAPDRRAQLLLELGSVEAFAGQDGWREHLPAALAAAEDDDVRAKAALALGHTFSRALEADAGLHVVDRAAARLDEADGRRRLTLEVAAVAIGMIDATTAPAVARRRRALRDRADADPEPSRDLLAATSFIAAVSSEPADVVAALARRALAPGAGQRLEPTAYPVFAPTTFALLWSGHHDELRRTLEAALAQARAIGDGFLLSVALTRRSWLGLRCGELVAAEADARAALEAADLPAPKLNRVLAASLLADALVEQGRLDEAEEALAPWQAEAEGPAMAAAVLRSARAHLRAAQHRHAEALADQLAAGEIAARTHAPAPGFLPWRSDAALAALALGDRDEAARLADEELALARASGAPRAIAVALRIAGVVCGGRRGEALLREAVATVDGAGDPLERARAFAALGAHVRRANRRSEARALLVEARDAARAAGALPLAAQAETDLAATGARSRSGPLGGVEALTPSERRVAGLAADGLTNRQIAQALFVTPRTVEGHLSGAFRKLDVTSRERLPAAMAG